MIDQYPTQEKEKLSTEETPALDTSRRLGRMATFSVLNRGSYPEIRRISSAAFPDEFKYFQKGGLKYLLKQPGADEFSFMITDAETRRVSGYCIAYYDENDDGVVDPTRIYVNNFAVSPDVQGSGLGLQGLSELLRRIKTSGGIEAIEMHARETTSYPAVMGHQDLIASLGYKVEDLGTETDGIYDPYQGIFDNEGEKTHHLVLSKVSDETER